MLVMRLIPLGFSLLAITLLVTACISDDQLATGPVEQEGPVAEDVAIAETGQQATIAELNRLVEARQPVRSEEGGVTVMRGAVPPALAALPEVMPSQAATPVPVPQVQRVSGPATGGSLVAAALSGSGAVVTAAAPGALASAGQLATLQAQPTTPVQVAELAPDLTSVSPAAGSPAVTQVTDSGDPIVDEVRRLASMNPTTIQELEARGASRMTTEEITALTVGNTLTHTNAENGFSASTYYDPNGVSQLINDGRALPSRYQISDGARCRIDSQGMGVCALLYRDGDTTWVCDQRDQGTCNWFVSDVVAGFAEN